MAGSYLTNGVYLPEISESPWGEQVNNNFVILSNGIDNVKIDYNTKLSGKLDRTSTTTQIINSNVNVNGEWNFANTVQGTITYAIHSNDADHAILADTATNANHANSADTAHTSDTSAYATSAYSSNYAERCNKAVTADSATKAKCDNDGNDISQTYLKISNYDTQTAITALNALREHIADEEAHTSLQQKNDIQNSFTNVNNRIDAVNDDLTAHKNNTDIHTSRQEKIDIQNNFNYLQSSLDTHANDTDLHLIDGNARTADEFKENKTIELSGDVTGTASSKGNWTISTVLANSGVVSGTYGQSSDISNQKTYQIEVPLITVDSKGRITNISTKTVTTTIPTKVSELANDRGYLTTHQSKSDLGLGNVSNYDQSKAIKSITRSGLTFSYTCLDGSTGTFTDNPNVVDLTSNQIIDGIKTFNETINGDLNGNANTCTEYFLNMVDTAEDLENALNTKPPTLKDVFETWYRFSHTGNTQYNLSNATGNALTDLQGWQFDENKMRIANNVNTVTYTGFISIRKYKKYTLGIKVCGPDEEFEQLFGTAGYLKDDDMFGIVCGYMKDNQGNEHTLSFIRDAAATICGLYYDYGKSTSVMLYDARSQITVIHKGNGESGGTDDGWYMKYAHMEVQRDGSTLNIRGSQINEDNYSISFTYNASDVPDNLAIDTYNNIRNMLLNKSSVGVSLLSQNGFMYLERFDGLFNSNDIYDTLNNVIYAYDSNNNSWYLTNRKVSDEVADYSRIYNENTEKSFVYYDEKTYMTSCNMYAGTGLSLSGTTFNVTSTAGSSALQWNSEVTLGTVGGLAIKAKLPQNPNTDTKYSAGTGLSLNGTQFNVNIPNYKVSDGTNPDATYIMTLDISQNACHPSQYTIGSLIDYINTHNTTYSAGTNMNLSGTTMNLNDSISVNSVNTGSLVVDGWTISIG